MVSWVYTTVSVGLVVTVVGFEGTVSVRVTEEICSEVEVGPPSTLTTEYDFAGALLCISSTSFNASALPASSAFEEPSTLTTAYERDLIGALAPLRWLSIASNGKADARLAVSRP